MVSRSVLVFLIACGGSSGGGGGDVTPFVGVYATSSHTHAETTTQLSCTDPGQPVSSATAFFKLAVDAFFMDPDVLRVSNCSDAAGATCNETGVSMRAGGPGLEDVSANSQTGGAMPCQLYYARAEATLTGTTIQIEVLEKYDAPNIAASDCTAQRAEALASATACRRIERWAGTRQ
jgi:hypothetical protein